MNEHVRIGRIFGIRIGLNWSLLVVFWLIAWTLAQVVLPSGVTGYRVVEYWVAGAAAAMIFLASILAHELGHSLVARRHGVKVDHIVLWMLGGIAHLQGEPRRPWDELKISIAGPAVSFAIGIFATLGALAAPWPLVNVTLAWLGMVNIVLAVFNLIPAAPLDGGRVLHSFLWHRHGDRLRATRSACRAGRATGWLMIAGGLVEIAFGLLIPGIWLGFLGWFLHQAAAQEEMSANLKATLSGSTVRDVMTADPVSGPDYVSVAGFVDHMVLQSRHSTYPLHNRSGEVTGFVTLGRLQGVPESARELTPVSQIAVPVSDAAVATPDEPAEAALARLSDRSEGRILVMDGATLAGLITPSDIARWMQLAALRVDGPRRSVPDGPAGGRTDRPSVQL